MCENFLKLLRTSQWSWAKKHDSRVITQLTDVLRSIYSMIISTWLTELSSAFWWLLCPTFGDMTFHFCPFSAKLRAFHSTSLADNVLSDVWIFRTVKCSVFFIGLNMYASENLESFGMAEGLKKCENWSDAHFGTRRAEVWEFQSPIFLHSNRKQSPRTAQKLFHLICYDRASIKP